MPMAVNTRDYIKPLECVQLQHKQEQKKYVTGHSFFSNRFCKKVKYCLFKKGVVSKPRGLVGIRYNHGAYFRPNNFKLSLKKDI